jgi:hypothetical protein
VLDSDIIPGKCIEIPTTKSSRFLPILFEPAAPGYQPTVLSPISTLLGQSGFGFKLYPFLMV